MPRREAESFGGTWFKVGRYRSDATISYVGVDSEPLSWTTLRLSGCGMPSDSILDLSLSCLAPHHLHSEWGDETAMDVFNRLLAENYLVRVEGKTRDEIRNTHLNIRREQIVSVHTTKTANWLAETVPIGNTSCAPRTTCPVILAVYQGEPLLLDGSKRIRWWLEHGDAGFHRVHIHTVTVYGSFIDLPSRAKPRS